MVVLQTCFAIYCSSLNPEPLGYLHCGNMSASDSRLARPLVWINGFPGTGILTIAKLLAALLDEAAPLLIDNHSLIDPVEAKFSRDHPNYQQLTRRGREAVFKSFVEDPAFRTRIVIFTGERNQPLLTSFYPSLI